MPGRTGSTVTTVVRTLATVIPLLVLVIRSATPPRPSSCRPFHPSLVRLDAHRAGPSLPGR
ncbi:uncharacterized protein B0H18DRAFT_1009789, partial [Fomitopsis serialis]|uniref:uncharacterized protein n=1 Tax=Fomitopsis serialis TaxID=139415 RepID=UPI0020088AFE